MSCASDYAHATGRENVMLRSTRVWAPVLALAAAASGCSSTSEKPATEIFSSPTYRYTVAHPASWSAIAAEHVLPADGPPLTAGGGTDNIGAKANTRVSKMELPALVIGAQEPWFTTAEDSTSSGSVGRATRRKTGR